MYRGQWFDSRGGIIKKKNLESALSPPGCAKGTRIRIAATHCVEIRIGIAARPFGRSIETKQQNYFQINKPKRSIADLTTVDIEVAPHSHQFPVR